MDQQCYSIVSMYIYEVNYVTLLLDLEVLGRLIYQKVSVPGKNYILLPSKYTYTLFLIVFGAVHKLLS